MIFPTRDEPLPERTGPYLIEGLIARGSTGVVYRARHSESGVSAAVKVVKAPRENLLQSMRREISALSRVHHPGIAEIFDYGSDEGIVWHAMELVEGPTLREWSTARRAQSSGAPAIGDSLALVADVASTLTFLHGEGLVHRDLKPENVIVSKGAFPVIVDFGLATRFPGGSNRETILGDADAAGTVAFMAPELISGDLVDARVDLYALGCILYELLTGHLPFEGNARAMLEGHLHGAVAPPSSFAKNVDPALDALVLRLLAKLPYDRPGYAEDVARALRGLGAHSHPSPEAPIPRAYLCRSNFIARASALELATGALDRLQSGRGGISVITGPSGIGKTRLAVEIMHTAAKGRIRVVAGSAAASTGAQGLEPGGAHFQPLGTTLEAIAFRCREWGPEESKRLLGGRSKVLAPFFPALADIAGVADEAEPDELKPEAARQRAVSAVADTLIAFSEAAPVLLVLDDIQWADDLTIALLELVARTRRFDEAPVLIIATVRQEEIGPQLQSLVDLPAVSRIPLDKLTTEELGGMISAMLASDGAPLDVLEPVVRRAEGNPFFVAEYLKLAVTEGFLGRDSDGRWQWGVGAKRAGKDGLDSLALPSTIADLMARRLATLDTGAREVAETASVLGREMDESTLRATMTLDKDVVDRAIDELRRRSVLEPVGARLRFEHDKLREELYGELSDTRRRALHRAAADTVAGELSRVEDESEQQRSFATLGHHYFEARELKTAVEYLEKAALRATEIHATHEAVSHLRAILGVADEVGLAPLHRARLERQLGSALAAVGHTDESRMCHERALKLLGMPFPHSKIALVFAIIGGLLLQGARRLTGTRATPPGSAEERALLVDACRSTEEICFMLSDTLAILYVSVRLVNLAESSGSAGEIARATATFGAMLGFIPMRGAADSYLARAAEAASESGDKASGAWVGMVDAYYSVGIGSWERGTKAAHRAYDLAIQAGELRRSEECLSLLCEIESLRGDPAKAIELADTGFASARKRGDRQTQLWALCDRARMLLAMDSNERAREALDEAAGFVEATVLADASMAAGLLALALVRLGDESGARDAATRAIETGERADPTVYHAMHGAASAVEALCSMAAVVPAPSDESALLSLARRGVRSLARYGGSFPVSRPKHCIAEGRFLRASGHAARARAAFSNAAKLGAELSMHHEVAIAEREIAALSSVSSPRSKKD